MIEEGRVYVNGSKVERAALNVTAADRITVDGKQVGEPDAPRLWLYHKPPVWSHLTAMKKVARPFMTKCPKTCRAFSRLAV